MCRIYTALCHILAEKLSEFYTFLNVLPGRLLLLFVQTFVSVFEETLRLLQSQLHDWVFKNTWLALYKLPNRFFDNKASLCLA